MYNYRYCRYCGHADIEGVVIDFVRFWSQVAIVALLDCLALVNNCHSCYFRRDTLFDLRRITIMVAVHNLYEY